MRLSEDLFPYFKKAGTLVSYHAHDIIYMQEDETTQLYLIVKGRVRVYIMTPTGEELTYEILDRGRIFGESSFFQNSPRPTTVSAVTDVELISCQLDDLYPFLSESKELTVSLLQLLSQTCDYLTSLLKKSYSYNRQEKLASFLLEQTEVDHPEKNIIDNIIPYTHEEIAMLVGLSRVTVTKVLKQFEKEHYVSCSYRKVKIIDRFGLQQLLVTK